jgi:NAD-dependent SIR2 family protein deacetylase
MPSQFNKFPPELIQILKAGQQVAVLRGAGISAESGVPTFREAQTGLWSQYDPSQLASPGAFHHNPQLVWKWYTWRRQLISQARPNPGHFALVEPAASLPFLALQRGARVIEVNIDQTPLTASADWHFAAPAGQFLPALVNQP